MYILNQLQLSKGWRHVQSNPVKGEALLGKPPCRPTVLQLSLESGFGPHSQFWFYLWSVVTNMDSVPYPIPRRPGCSETWAGWAQVAEARKRFSHRLSCKQFLSLDVSSPCSVPSFSTRQWQLWTLPLVSLGERNETAPDVFWGPQAMVTCHR
jgi:hypothetical protein